MDENLRSVPRQKKPTKSHDNTNYLKIVFSVLAFLLTAVCLFLFYLVSRKIINFSSPVDTYETIVSSPFSKAVDEAASTEAEDLASKYLIAYPYNSINLEGVFKVDEKFDEQTNLSSYSITIYGVLDDYDGSTALVKFPTQNESVEVIFPDTILMGPSAASNVKNDSSENYRESIINENLGSKVIIKAEVKEDKLFVQVFDVFNAL